MTVWKDFVLQDQYMDLHDFENPTRQSAIQFGEWVDPALVGMNAETIAEINQLFDQRYQQGQYHAAQLVILRHGQVVLDRFAGNTGRNPNEWIDADTPFLNFSANKAFTAMCVHKLIGNVSLEWDAPVAKYWPEFGQKGKESTTIRQVFTHCSGIGQPHLMRQIWLWPNWKRVIQDIAETPAEYPPGEACSYQTVNFGFIFGEIIRRVTGMNIGRYLHKTILEPLGMKHSYLPIDDENLKHSPRLSSQGRTYRGIAKLFNLPIIRKAVIPAASMHASARDLAVFYQMLLNGGEYDHNRIFEPATIGRAISPGYQGMDRTLKTNAFWAHGFHLGGEGHEYHRPPVSQKQKNSSERKFSHYGIGTAMAWADWREQVVVAFTCSHMPEPARVEARWNEINDLVWKSME